MAASCFETNRQETPAGSGVDNESARQKATVTNSKLRTFAIDLHLRLLRLFFKTRPIPLEYWLRWKSILGGSFVDVLAPGTAKAELKTPELRPLISVTQRGGWALDAATLDLVWNRLVQEQPKTVLECGAGTSTVMFAKYASMIGGENVRIVALEQDAETKSQVEHQLAQGGGNASIRILHSPLSPRSEYQFDRPEMRHLTQPEGADWIFIDGPAGPDGCRTHTLQVLAQYSRAGATWFLDDAFRDGELETLRVWSKTRGLTVEGIYPIGKGLATGKIEHPDQFILR